MRYDKFPDAVPAKWSLSGLSILALVGVMPLWREPEVVLERCGIPPTPFGVAWLTLGVISSDDRHVLRFPAGIY